MENCDYMPSCNYCSRDITEGGPSGECDTVEEIRRRLELEKKMITGRSLLLQL